MSIFLKILKLEQAKKRQKCENNQQGWLPKKRYGHYVKSLHIWSYSGPYFPAFGLNTERYPNAGYLSLFSPNAGNAGMRTRITPNTNTFNIVDFNTKEYFEMSPVNPSRRFRTWGDEKIASFQRRLYGISRTFRGISIELSPEQKNCLEAFWK